MKMAHRRIETPSEAVVCGCLYLFIGIFMDCIWLMTIRFPLNPAWILFLILPALGIVFVAFGLYYRSKGLGWDEYLPWVEKRILHNYPGNLRREETPSASGWWKICTECEAKADLDATKCPACGDSF